MFLVIVLLFFFIIQLTYGIFIILSSGLADENESVREAALGAGHILVEHYAIS